MSLSKQRNLRFHISVDLDRGLLPGHQSPMLHKSAACTTNSKHRLCYTGRKCTHLIWTSHTSIPQMASLVILFIFLPRADVGQSLVCIVLDFYLHICPTYTDLKSVPSQVVAHYLRCTQIYPDTCRSRFPITVSRTKISLPRNASLPPLHFQHEGI